MEQAIIELTGCISYTWGKYNFRRNIPQYVKGKEAIEYFRSQGLFNIRPAPGGVPPTAKAAPVPKADPVPKMPEVEPKVEVEPEQPVVKKKTRVVKRVAKKKKRATTS